MPADVAGFVTCDNTAERTPLPGGLVHDTDLRPGQAHYFCREFKRALAVRNRIAAARERPPHEHEYVVVATRSRAD